MTINCISNNMDIANDVQLQNFDSLRKYLKSATKSGCAALNTTDTEQDGSFLYWCCAHGQDDLVEQLIQLGADINDSNSAGLTPLHAAADMNRLEIAKHLIKSGANINQQTEGGQTALHLAAFRGHTKIVQLLLKSEADASLTNSTGRTALHEAYVQQHNESVIALTSVEDNNISGPSQGLPMSINVPLGYRKSCPVEAEYMRARSVPTLYRPTQNRPTSYGDPCQRIQQADKVRRTNSLGAQPVLRRDLSTLPPETQIDLQNTLRYIENNYGCRPHVYILH